MWLRKDRVLLAASFLYLAVANLIWISRDTRPPFWDMAYHSSAALRIYNAMEVSGVRAIRVIPYLTGFYPPLFQSVVAVFWLIFGKTVAVSRLANFPAMAILLLATYGIGKRLFSPVSAAAAAILVTCYPLLLWISRETIIDYWLTSMVALAMWGLLRTEEFSDRWRSILFGVICGLGVLTKWTFPFFLVLPSAWLARRNWKNALLAASIAGCVGAYWYVPSGASLVRFLAQNTAGGVSEGDPERLSWQAIVFYVRALEGYQLFLPLFIAFLLGAFLLSRRYSPAWAPVVLWIVGGWLGLMLLRNKDPRYTAPFLPAIALITAMIVEQWRRVVPILIAFLAFQHYLVSFGTRRLPQAIVLEQGTVGPDSYDWNLYTQTYSGLWGRPAHEDWKIDHVLDLVTPVGGRRVQLGLVPDIPRFDSQAFEFYIALRNLPVTVNPVRTSDESAILKNDFILVSENDQGFAKVYAPDLERVNEYILSQPRRFHFVEWFPLPGGQVIRLYGVK